MRRALILVGVLAFALSLPATASAATTHTGEDHGRAAQVVISGRVIVPVGQRVGVIVVVHGRVTVAGTADGAVVVVDGTATVSGTVEGDVVVFHGDVTLLPGAHVTGDVIAGGAVRTSVGAAVDGEVRPHSNLGFLGRVGRIVVWVAVSFSTLVLLLLLLAFAPRALDRVEVAGRTNLPASIGWGFAVGFGLPVLIFASFVSLVGIPFGLGMLAALPFVYSLGYVLGSWFVGRLILPPPRGRIWALLTGWIVLRAAGLIPVFGGFVWFAASIVGLGAGAVAVWRARKPLQRTPTVSPPPPPPPVPAGRDPKEV